jgi:phage tail sheath protein FI
LDKYLPYAVEGFFGNGGQNCYVCRVKNGDYVTALSKTETIADISLVYTPNAQATAGLANLLIDHCEQLKRFAIFDSVKGQETSAITKPRDSSYAALYYPWLYVKLNANTKALVPPGGHIAGIYARVDSTKGVNKAPADEQLNGITGVEHSVSNLQVQTLNPRGINCIRNFEGRGILVWGARTLSISDLEYKYINVRRLLIYLEQSIVKGTAWAVFEQNNEATWAKIATYVKEFLIQAWKEGKLQGAKPQEAYFVKCDRTTMTQNDIEAGRLIIEVGVAAVKPAEFTILRASQTLTH